MRSLTAPHVDYGFLYGLVEKSPNFVPSDIDGVIERNGVFLFFEWKNPLEDMNAGQEKMLISLAKKPDIFVVKIIGDTINGVPTIYEFFILKGEEWVNKGKSLSEFIDFYLRWIKYASENYE